MISTLIASFVLNSSVPMVCPVAGDEISDGAQHYVFGGLMTAICCAGCEAPLKAEPAKVLLKKRDALVAFSLFDPVSKARVSEKQAKAWTDFNGVRYFFASTENKTAFGKSAAKFAAIPANEVAGKCAVKGEKIAMEDAVAFRDVNGTRYYFCCMGCVSAFDKAPATYTTKLHPTKAALVKAKEAE